MIGFGWFVVVFVIDVFFVFVVVIGISWGMFISNGVVFGFVDGKY